MTRLIAFFARHPTAANLLMLGILTLGLSALPNLKRETFPEFTPSKVQVRVAYPGASTADSETALCIPMEEVVDGLINLAKMTCESRENIAILTLEMSETGDMNRFQNDIKSEIDSIDSFPQQVENPVYVELGRTDRLITLALSADIPDFELKVYAETIKSRMKNLPGISMIDIAGFSDQQLRVELSLPLLRQYSLSVNDVVNKIQKQNIRLPSGNIETTDKTTLLRFDQRQVNAETLADLVIGSSYLGGELRLGDIATINERFEKDESKVYFNDKPSALLKVKKNKEQDAIELAKVVYNFVEQEKQRAPEGVELVLTNDTSRVVNDRLTMLTTNSWQGLILVFATMWMFFAWRYSFWVSMGLPVSFLGAFWLMIQLGISINMISLVALLMAIGILMDDAIVLAESVAAHVENGLKEDIAVINGVMLVAPGVTSSFLTTACIFSGIAFISGDIGQVMKVLPIVLLAVLIVSLIEAFLILPNHLLHSLKSGNASKSSDFKEKFRVKFEQFRSDQLVRWLEKAVTFRYFSIGATIALFILSFSLFTSGFLKFIAFPNPEGNIAEMRLLMPQGTSIHKTESYVEEAIKKLHQINEQLTPEQPNNQPLIKNTTIEFINLEASEEGTHLATIRVDLLNTETRTTSLFEFNQLWRESVGQIPGAISITFKEPSFGPAGRPFEILLHGNDLDILSQASVEIQRELNKFEGVFDVMDDLRPGKEEWSIKLQPGVLAFNIDGAMIANQLRAAYFGEIADEFQRGNDTIEIDVRVRQSDKESIQQLKNFPIVLPDGTQIPLSAVVELTPQRGFARISRIDGKRTVTVMGDIDPERANTQEIVGVLQSGIMLELLEKYPELSISYEGEVKQGGETSSSIFEKFVLGLLGVFIILSFQFRSYFEPIMVMLAIPLALIGAMWGHLLLGYDFTIPSLIGFVSLAGIVVNDSILLVSYIKKHQSDGVAVYQSAINAARDRFRAVFITSVTTVAGTLPLLLESSLQAQVLQPMIVSLVFGIISSTILILFFLPGIYCILSDWGLVSDAHMVERKSRFSSESLERL